MSSLKQALSISLHKPINVATYQMARELPNELKKELPYPEQISRLLEYID